MGEGSFPAEFDRVNWGALVFGPVLALVYGMWEWVAAFATLLLGSMVVREVAARFDSQILARAQGVTGALLWPCWLVASIAFGVLVNGQLWERERQEFEATGGDPVAPIPLWRFRASVRFWTRLSLAAFVLGLVWVLAVIAKGQLTWTRPGPVVLLLPALLVYDRIRIRSRRR